MQPSTTIPRTPSSTWNEVDESNDSTRSAGILLTDGRQMIERWKQHFEKHLNDQDNRGTENYSNGVNDYASAIDEENGQTSK